MKQFPDERSMEKSEISGDPIRGGSIGLNRVLGRFVERSSKDHHPEFTACLLSAYTIFRNVWNTDNKATDQQLEEAFVRDVNLFLDYYDTYISFVSSTQSPLMRGKYCPVIVYFPEYNRVDRSLVREHTGQKLEMEKRYHQFLKRYNGRDELVRTLDYVKCYWIRAGDATYPHREVVRKFHDINFSNSSLYHSGDKISLMSHIPLDYYMSFRIRGIHLLESFTGEFKGSDQFKFRLDKEGRIPFNSVCHVTFGDSVLIKPMIGLKAKRLLLEAAEKDRWVTRSEDDLRNRISRIADIPLRELRKFDFV